VCDVRLPFHHSQDRENDEELAQLLHFLRYIYTRTITYIHTHHLPVQIWNSRKNWLVDLSILRHVFFSRDKFCELLYSIQFHISYCFKSGWVSSDTASKSPLKVRRNQQAHLRLCPNGWRIRQQHALSTKGR